MKIRSRTLWALAAGMALLGSWLLFDTLPGAGWTVWVAVASLGLVGITARLEALGTPVAPVAVMGGAATVVAGSAMVTSNPIINVLCCAAVILVLALQMLLSGGREWRPLTLPLTLAAPFLAFGSAVAESVRRAVGLTNELRSPLGGALLRGAALTLPVLIIFALLLSNADPVFAGWRNTADAWLEGLDFLPRAIFFLALLTLVVGAYGFAAAQRSVTLPTPTSEWRILGATERLMLLGSVAALFWVFLAVQLSYLFGTSPAQPGSGVTFAEYARSGFAELTVVSTATALLIIAGEVLGRPEGGRRKALRVVTIAVLVAVMLLVASAFNRVLLYEEAYGHTVARLYGKTYMIAVAFGVVALGLEIAGKFNSGRLFRRVLAVVTILFVGLAYWNHEAWIASRNIDRFQAGGELDIHYLIRELSPDALPAVGERLTELPPAEQEAIREEVRLRYSEQGSNFDRSWHEWNVSRSRAERSLAQDFGVVVR